MLLSNFDKWRFYNEGLISPDIYIDFSFYYLISAALQRRVWIGPTHSPLYPNLYIILVGEPGIGKGLVIKQISQILQFHKLKNPRETVENNSELSSLDKDFVKAVAEADYDEAMRKIKGESKGAKKGEVDKPLLFPVAAESTTYEALVNSLANSIRRINYKHFDERQQKEVMLPYAHSSICFCLEEISSLFRKKTEDLVNLLIQTYDCGDYIYETKTQGKDRIKRCCLSFFGGTTPGFMQSTFDDRLLTEGFASRTFFLFAASNRKTAVRIPDLSHEQVAAYYHIVNHVQKLSTLYGRVEVPEEVWKFLEEWWKDSQQKRVNTNPRLNPYYSRKPAHVQKLAMAIHFAESTEMKMGLEPFQVAINMLAYAEKYMHMSLGLDNNNPLAKPMMKIQRFLQQLGPKTERELLAEFWSALPKGKEDMQTILQHLCDHDIIEPFEQMNVKLKITQTLYRIVPKISE
jgi:dephospho-CoA kinase